MVNKTIIPRTTLYTYNTHTRKNDDDSARSPTSRQTDGLECLNFELFIRNMYFFLLSIVQYIVGENSPCIIIIVRFVARRISSSKQIHIFAMDFFWKLLTTFQYRDYVVYPCIESDYVFAMSSVERTIRMLYVPPTRKMFSSSGCTYIMSVFIFRTVQNYWIRYPYGYWKLKMISRILVDKLLKPSSTTGLCVNGKTTKYTITTKNNLNLTVNDIISSDWESKHQERKLYAPRGAKEMMETGCTILVQLNS